MTRTATPLGERLARVLDVPAWPAGEVSHGRAAVLVGLVECPAPSLFLTRRAAGLSVYPGHLAFAGGRVEADDTGPADTALREAAEELGLEPACVVVAGALPPVRSRSQRLDIVPVVGTLAEAPALTPGPAEVAEVLEVPLLELCAAKPYELAWPPGDGSLRTIGYRRPGQDIVGLTARIVEALCEALVEADR